LPVCPRRADAAALQEKRLLEEARVREAQRKADEQQAREMQQIKEQAAELERRTGKKLNVDSLASLDERRRLVEREVAALADEKRRQEQRVQTLVRQVDYSVRLLRETERPLRERQYEQKTAEDEAFHHDASAVRALAVCLWVGADPLLAQRFLKEQREEFERMQEERGRLSRIVADKDVFMAKLMGPRRAAYEQQVAAWRAKTAGEADRRKREREQRARDRAAAARRAAEAERAAEDERRRKDEGARPASRGLLSVLTVWGAAEAAERRTRDEAAAKRRADEEERRRKLDEIVRLLAWSHVWPV
jgi:translation initiation factor 3 subunit A